MSALPREHTVYVVQPDEFYLLTPYGTVHKAKEEHCQYQKER